MGLEVAKRRFTVEDYHRMAAAGILREDDRVELLEGEVVEMSPIGRRHAACVDRLLDLFRALPRAAAQLRVQSPIRLDAQSEPQPDMTLLRPRVDFYRDSDPGPGDVLLVCEVADTSLDLDRLKKLPLYAEAGVPEVWIVDLGGEAIEVHREPAGSAYRTATRHRAGERVTPSLVPGLSLAVEAVLGLD